MKLKKLAIAVVFSALSIMAVVAHAAPTVRVYVDNNEIMFDAAPAIVDGRVMVPVRAVFEKAGATVEWNGDTRITTLKLDDYEVTIREGDPFLVKNGEAVALDVPATIIEERLAIPVRAIAEAMDFGVTWNGVRSSVLIATNGKEYRANSQWKTGFHTLKQGGFLSEHNLDDIRFFDLDGDDENDALAFIPTKVLADGTKEVPALWINATNFNSVLATDMDPYAVAVADIVSSDKYKEVIVLYNSEDGKCAGFYRYNGADVFQIKANNTENGMIYFNNNLFIDGVENIISDVDGLCFLDNMICTGIYSLENSEICRYMLNVSSNIEDREFIRSYDDDLPYCYREVSEYNKGEYVDTAAGDDVIYSNDIASFKILDFYVDDQDPSKFEFFVEMPDKSTFVIWPYRV